MKAVIIGDNLIPSGQFLARCGPLRDAGYDIQAFDWLWADRNEMNQRNLSVENHGPEAEPVPDGLVEAVVDADIVLTHFCPIPQAVVESGQELKAIGVARGGWENSGSFRVRGQRLGDDTDPADHGRAARAHGGVVVGCRPLCDRYWWADL